MCRRGSAESKNGAWLARRGGQRERRGKWGGDKRKVKRKRKKKKKKGRIKKKGEGVECEQWKGERGKKKRRIAMSV